MGNHSKTALHLGTSEIVALDAKKRASDRITDDVNAWLDKGNVIEMLDRGARSPEKLSKQKIRNFRKKTPAPVTVKDEEE